MELPRLLGCSAVMFIAIVSALLLLFATPAVAEPRSDGYLVQLESVYDADTFRVTFNDWPAIVGHNIPIRLRGVDAAEIRGKCAKEKQLAQQAKAFTLRQLTEAKEIQLHNLERGKYFRLIADVSVDGRDLASLLLAAQLARPYQGGTRQGWCN